MPHELFWKLHKESVFYFPFSALEIARTMRLLESFIKKMATKIYNSLTYISHVFSFKGHTKCFRSGSVPRPSSTILGLCGNRWSSLSCTLTLRLYCIFFLSVLGGLLFYWSTVFINWCLNSHVMSSCFVNVFNFHSSLMCR